MEEKGAPGKYTVRAHPAERPRHRLVVAPRAGKRRPSQAGAARQDPRLLAKGQHGPEEARTAAQPGPAHPGGMPTACSSARSRLASCCSSYLFPSATSFFPVALTTHCNARACAQSNANSSPRHFIHILPVRSGVPDHARHRAVDRPRRAQQGGHAAAGTTPLRACPHPPVRMATTRDRSISYSAARDHDEPCSAYPFASVEGDRTERGWRGGGAGCPGGIAPATARLPERSSSVNLRCVPFRVTLSRLSDFVCWPKEIRTCIPLCEKYAVGLRDMGIFNSKV